MAETPKKNTLVGSNYTTPDIVAKVTGKAKYAEDFRAEGMLFAKLLLSPMPHAKILSIDTSAAMAMPGVKAILTVDDLPKPTAGASLGEGITASTLSERGLTMEPMYEGEPILAIAAVDELTAAEAIEKIQIEYEPMSFSVDPIASLRPDGANAREQGNAWVRPTAPAAPARGAAPAAGAAAGAAAAAPAAPGTPAAAPASGAAAAPQANPASPAAAPAAARPDGGAAPAAAAGAAAAQARGAAQPGPAPGAGRGAGPAPARPEVQSFKWTQADFDEAPEGQLPLGKHTDEWSYGDLDAAMKNAAVVIDRTWVGNNTSHQVLEPRSAMAYWQNGKLYLHAGTQSTVQTVPNVARWCGIEPKDVVLISEYCGGGFGSRIPGYIAMSIPSLLSKKANAPVMMRITREDEHYIGRARPAVHSRVKAAFSKEGKLLGVDMYAIVENGPFDQVGDNRTAGDTVSLTYQPESMRWRGIAVLTNTPPRGAQRAPGGMQGQALFEPILAEAGRKLGIDEVQMHLINAPEGKAKFGPANPRGQRNYVTSSFAKDALTRGAEIFNWEEKKARSGKKVGTKVRGSGVALSTYSAGSIGFDGLLVIRPDGIVQFQSGIGNLGTHCVMDVHRVAADILDVPWEQCEVVWGNTSKHLPWTSASGGSQTTHAMTRAAHALGTAAVKQLQEMCAQAWGGSPAAYRVAGGKVTGNGRTITFQQIAQKAIELGGKFDGHEPPEDVNNWTKTSSRALAGQGFIVSAKDNYPRDGQTRSFVSAFAEVEVDLETGKYHIVDFAAVADVGTVINPRSLKGQTFGGCMLGIGHAISQKWVYDQHYGVPLAKRMHYNRPPTILDAPQQYSWDAVNKPDPETPAGARGIGEPPVGAGCAAVLNAIAAAVGDEVFRRMPVTADMILMALEHGKVMHEPLTANI